MVRWTAIWSNVLWIMHYIQLDSAKAYFCTFELEPGSSHFSELGLFHCYLSLIDPEPNLFSQVPSYDQHKHRHLPAKQKLLERLFGCWSGLLSPGHGRLFAVLSPSPGLSVLQRELYVISLSWHVTSCHFPPLRLCCRPQINNIAWEVQAGFAATPSSVFLKEYVRKCKVS